MIAADQALGWAGAAGGAHGRTGNGLWELTDNSLDSGATLTSLGIESSGGKLWFHTVAGFV